MEFKHCGAKARFEDVEDIHLSAAYRRYNSQLFDGLLSSNVKVRWAELIGPRGFFEVNGWLPNVDPSEPYLFIDSRLKCLYPRTSNLVDLVLLHEMCHFRARNHDEAFVVEMLTALERASWEPLVTKCVPIPIEEIMSKRS